MMALIRCQAALQRRSLAGQVRHWARVGRIVEESGVLNYRQIRILLRTYDTPTPAERERMFAGDGD